VEFELRSVPDLWTITGDPTQLHQVLLNLCVNARDAMPAGGKLSIHMENVMFDETYAGHESGSQGGSVCVHQSGGHRHGNSEGDTGQDLRSVLYDQGTRQRHGAGLSTTLAIVKSHGGFIHCHSAPGKGSTFEIYLPANATLVAVENAEEESQLPCGHNELVLVVDDEEPIRNLAQKVLTRFGYRVLLAADGAEAVSLTHPGRTKLTWSSRTWRCRSWIGSATILALKAINSDVKIVSSSGLASNGGMTKAKDAGIQHFIPKPYTAETMLNTLHEALHGNPAN